MATYRILSIDGGGLRGIIPATIIKRLSDTPEIANWLDQANLIAGTSTGGILALGLAAGLELNTIVSLYQERGQKIFHDDLFDDLRDVGNLLGAEYSSAALLEQLREVFGAKTLGDLPKRVVVTAFDLDNQADEPAKRTWSPKIFHNFPGPDSDAGQLVVDVAACTSAAPTYFPSFKGYVDGGVFANNPSMVALVQALDARNPPDERARLDEIVLLSLGTGQAQQFIEGDDNDWGLAQWASPLLNILMNGVAGIAHFQCKQLLGKERYRRLQIVYGREERIPLDAVEKTGRMIELAEQEDLSQLVEWIQQQWY